MMMEYPLIAAGPNSHYKKWVNHVYVTICAATSGPCAGHGKSAPPASTAVGGKWCAKGLHQDMMRKRTDNNGMVCRGCERDRERARAKRH